MLIGTKSLIRISLSTPLAIILIVLACTQEEELLKAKVDTLTVKIEEDSVYLNGNVNSLGSAKAVKLGFVIGREQFPDLNNSESIVLYKNVISTGAFSISVLNDFEKNEIYYIRAFYVNSHETVYGDQISFSHKVEVILKMEDFMPKQGVEGDYVKIFGSGFGVNKDGIKVIFGSEEAEITSIIEERIIVKIPPYESAGFCTFTVHKKDFPSVSLKDSFLLEGPHIQSFTPEKGLGNVKVTINGKDFSEVPWKNVVMVGEAKAEVFEASQDKIIALINTDYIKKGEYRISVRSNGIKTVSEKYFEVLNPWTQVENIPTGLRFSAAFKIRNKIFLCTGNTIDQGEDAVFEYQVDADQWVMRGNFPGGNRVQAVGFSIGEKGYLATGSTSLNNEERKSDLWEYDPASDKWTQKADLPGGERQDAVSFSFNGKGYVGMGTSAFGWIKRQDFWQYDPKVDQWQQLPDFKGNGRIFTNTALIGNKFYVIGGHDPNTSFASDIWEFNLDNHKWTFIGVLNIYPVASFSFENKCYLIIHKWQEELQLVEFDPAINRIVKELAIFPGIKRLSGSFSIAVDGQLFFGGGSALQVQDFFFDVWKYPINTSK